MKMMLVRTLVFIAIDVAIAALLVGWDSPEFYQVIAGMALVNAAWADAKAEKAAKEAKHG